MIGIIGAMDEEIKLLQKQIKDMEKYTFANMHFYKGKINNKHIVLLQCGIGKVNASLGTAILHERFSPKIVINTGSAGGFDKELNIGDLVISNKVIQHDVDVTAFNYEYGQIPHLPTSFPGDKDLISKAEETIENMSLNYKIGLIATGDQFLNKPNDVKVIQEKFPNILAADMEAGAIAQVCYRYETPFVIIRALSDIAGKEANVLFDEFLQKAAEHSTKLILKMISNYI